MTLPGVHRSGQTSQTVGDMRRRHATAAMVTVSPSEPIRKASCCVWADPDERLQCCTEVNVPHRAAQSGGRVRHHHLMIRSTATTACYSTARSTPCAWCARRKLQDTRVAGHARSRNPQVHGSAGSGRSANPLTSLLEPARSGGACSITVLFVCFIGYSYEYA